MVEPLFVDIGRDSILRRLFAARPRLVLVTAPPGYGKSTVVRQYAAKMPSSALCDCMEALSPLALAQEVASSMASSDPDRATALAQQRLSGSNDPGSWSAFTMNSWLESSPHDLFIFENVERILDTVETVEFFSRLLARAPRERRIAICSRRPLPFPWHRFFAPHDVVTLRSNDLRFDASEIAQVFATVELPPETLRRVTDITQGWPIAVLLLARVARERSVRGFLDGLDGLDFEDLYDYLADQALAAMPAERLARLLAVAAIPHATSGEVAAALDDPEAQADLAVFARTSPFLYAIADDVYEAHPLVRAMLEDRYAARCRETLLGAACAIAKINSVRAAQLYVEAGDHDAAADLLQNVSEIFVSDLSPAAADVISKLERDVVLRHPSVWSAAVVVRASTMSDLQWLEEALVVREHINASTPVGVRMGVLANLSNVLTNLGRHDEALRIVESIDRPGVPSRYRRVGRLIEAAVAARRGYFSRAAEIWRDLEPLLVDTKYAHAIGLEEVAVRVARFRGDRASERSELERAIALARESRTAHCIALMLVEAIFAAWFAGEEGLFERYARELEAAVAPNTARGTEVFRACTRGDFEPLKRAEGYEHPKIRAYAALIGCSYASGSTAADLALSALKAADECGEPMTAAIACVATASCDDVNRGAYIDRARAYASGVDSEALRAAIEAYARGDPKCGILSPLVRRLDSFTSVDMRPEAPAICVSLARCRVERSGKEVKLSNRELEVVLFLAARRRGYRSDEVIEALWPESEQADQGVLRVNVKRVRSKLGDAAIIAAPGGYARGESLVVDLEQMERATLQARQQRSMSPDLRAELETHLEQLLSAGSSRSDVWEWFEPVRIRLDDLMREIATLLGRNALRTGNIETALSLGQRIIERDPCDEPARELRIRAHIAAGDRASASREFRLYREVLASELGAKPSAALAALVREEAPA